jgi:hypothetical protein
MKTLLQLKLSATKSTTFRGHDMKKWLPITGGAIRECRDCGSWVQVLTQPQANQIDIGGAAVAQTCKTMREQ